MVVMTVTARCWPLRWRKTGGPRRTGRARVDRQSSHDAIIGKTLDGTILS
jgi:hypothetical protein